MVGKKHEPRLHLDMPFGEAVERYAETDPREVEASVIASKKKLPGPSQKTKRPGSKKAKKVT